jgi:3-oxoacyl-[acyl-carrier protein] reductase
VTRVAIVTGAARGLGEAIARRLHADGYSVALTGLGVEGVENVAAQLGDNARAFEHDVRELASWEQLLDGVRFELGEDVYALVNNAARDRPR